MKEEKCPWCLGKYDAYEKYHDEEWGVPVYSDQVHFEYLTLESAQAGLSWSTVLSKRNSYKAHFQNFDVHKVAALSDRQLDTILKDPGIIRNRAKVYAARNNAHQFILLQKEIGSFSDYLWSYVNNSPIIGYWNKQEDVPANTSVSDKISHDLKKRGFKFVGSTIIYAHLQAAGLVNDHVQSCYRFKEILNGYANA